MWFSLKYSWTYSFASIFLDVVDLGWVNECTFFSKLFFDIILLESNRIFFITVVSWLNLVAPLLCNLTFIFINMIFFCLTITNKIKILIQERKIRIKYLCNADGALHLKRQIEIGQINLKIFLKKKIVGVWKRKLNYARTLWLLHDFCITTHLFCELYSVTPFMCNKKTYI